MCIYSYCFIASARADTHSHEVTCQDNYIVTFNLLNWSYNMQHKFSWNK